MVVCAEGCEFVCVGGMWVCVCMCVCVRVGGSGV